MFGFNCVGYGVQNTGYWGYPGFGFGIGGYGYDPKVSDTVMIGQSIISGINGITAGIDAHYNHGLNGFDSARVAVGTAAVGTSNALLGNIIDKNTGTYTGSIMNSTLSTFTNPFVANVGLSAGAMMTSPFMNPFVRPFGPPVGCTFGMGFGFYC